MADDNRDKWHRLPKLSLNARNLTKRMRKAEGATVRHAHKFIVKRWSNVRDVQRRIITWSFVVSLLIAATGLQLMWYQQSYRTSAPSKDGTYAEAVLGPVETLNPLFANSDAEKSASQLMFSRLMNYDTTGHLNNDIATETKINDDKTVYIVKIRPDVKWHDGMKLTAEDVAFTVGLLKNPDVRTSIGGWDDVSVNVIDDTTIEFSRPSTYAAFKHLLTFPILPKHLLSGVIPSTIRENSFSNNPVGSGPFTFRFTQNTGATSSQKVIYMASNNTYYNGTPSLARFQLHIYDTRDNIARALNMNEVNAAAGLHSTDLHNIDQKRYEVDTAPVQVGVYAILNTKSEILSDAGVRRALQVATNTQSIREKLPIDAPSLDLPFTNDQLSGGVPKAPKFDLKSAANMLDKAGWKLNGNNVRIKDKKELQLSVVTVKNGEFERVLEGLAGQWRSLGIVVNTQIVDPNDVSQNFAQNVLQPRNYDVLIYPLSIGADPDVYIYWHSSQATSQGYNFANYSNAVSDDALSSARARVEPDLRNAKYITFAKQWLSDVPAIGLYQMTAQYVHSRNVNSSDESVKLVSSTNRYSDVLWWSVGSRTVYKTP